MIDQTLNGDKMSIPIHSALVHRRAGPQPFNQIAGTANEQLARVFQPRKSRSRRVAERLAPEIRDILIPDFVDMIQIVIEENRR
jgi:hypothetical protein